LIQVFLSFIDKNQLILTEFTNLKLWEIVIVLFLALFLEYSNRE